MPATAPDDLSRKHLWQVIREVGVALLTSQGRDGRLRTRAVATQNGAPHCGPLLYFFVPAYGEIANDFAPAAVAPVGVVYAQPQLNRFVSLTGEACLQRHPQRQTQLWTARALARFPGGAQDPDLRLLEVRLLEAEYRDTRTLALLHRIDFDSDARPSAQPVVMPPVREALGAARPAHAAGHEYAARPAQAAPARPVHRVPQVGAA